MRARRFVSHCTRDEFSALLPVMIGLVNTDELPSCPSRRGIAAHAPAHGAEHVTQECAAPLLPIDLVALSLVGAARFGYAVVHARRCPVTE
jgi:hypothetical protein